jgi:D-alanyl-D-alanine carboxypeptidase/D-alanyl-D-alanine-endopeptidase (penicillin-binding protein 4)
LVVLLAFGASLSVTGLGWWHRVQREPATVEPLDTIEPNEPTGSPDSWMAGYLLIPDALPPPTGAERLEVRLSSFAHHVEQIRADVDPPLVAFGAEALHDDLETIIGRVDDRAQVSVHIRDLDSGRVLFDYFGDTLLNPASNHKLLTTSAALDLLGPDYEFETRVLLVGETLYLVGEGDPTIDGEALGVLAREVAERIPAGDLAQIVVDDTAFSPRGFGPGYSEDGGGASYMAPSGALSVNFNTVEISVYPITGIKAPAVRIEPPSAHILVANRAKIGTKTSLEIRSSREAPAGVEEPTREQVQTRIEITGTVARTSHGYRARRRVVDPGLFTGGAFAQMLAGYTQTEPLPVRSGLAPAIEQTVLDDQPGDGDHIELPLIVGHTDPGDVLLVAQRHSPPLIEVVGGLLTYSNNFMAEQILRTLGWRMTGDPGDWDNGSAVILGYWEALGHDPASLVFENGSGLSTVGRVTTSGLVDLMAMAARTQTAGSSLLDVLPVAGTDGTVRTRLRRSNKRVRAKTGTLDGVSGLTGVITTEDGVPRVAFSILINVRQADHMAAATRRRTEDAIVMSVLDHIDGWEAIRGTLVREPPLAVTPE